MNYYKPYSYLYKVVTEPSQLKSCFVIWLPALKNLSGPNISSQGNKTTISYAIVTDNKKTIPWQFEDNNDLSWNGNTWEVEIIIGSGSGANGGGVVNTSTSAEDM